jgi:3-oxoacyl-[acyl-carrier protein] reductase
MRLKDKVAIITGAGRGIGQATAIKFAREGAKVMVCDIKQDWIDETVRKCKEAGSDAIGQVADVRDPKSLAAMVKATVDKWGRVDCLVNNAGIVADAQLKNMTEDQFDSVIDINLKGVYNCTRAVVDQMLGQKSGVIRKGIRVNAVCPGFIATTILGSIPEKVIHALEERVPMGRLGKPEEIANTFAFLASDEASSINGAAIEVSGGLTI